MSATGPEGEGGAGSVAVATVGEPTAGSAFKMRSRAPSSPHPQFLGPKECVFFFRISELERTSNFIP